MESSSPQCMQSLFVFVLYLKSSICNDNPMNKLELEFFELIFFARLHDSENIFPILSVH